LPPGGDEDTDPSGLKRKRDTYYDNQEDLIEKAAKDDLTLMVRQLHPKAGEFDVFSLFSKVGKVLDVRLIVDERSGKCQGVGYVEMGDQKGFLGGLQLTGSEVCGQAIIVQASLAEKNRLAAAGASSAEIKAFSGTVLPPVADGLKLYVGGLHYDISEEQLKQLFEPFGELSRVDLHREADSTSKGYGFVHFKQAADGHRCIEQMDGFTLAGRAIRVSVSQQNEPASAATQLLLNSMAAQQMLQAGGAGGIAMGEVIAPLDSLDDSSGGGKVTAAQRASIMTKLAEGAGLEVPKETLKAAQTAGLATQEESRCVVLKNMFDRLSDEASSNPNFFNELAEEVRSEVSKTGTVLHCAADKWSNGFVYIKMLAHSEAANLRDLMHGRYFAKNKIIAELMDEALYNKKNKIRA